MEIDTSMNIESILFKEYKEYLENNSKFSPKVLPSSAKQLTTFPTVLFKEENNITNVSGTTIDKSQLVDQITDIVEIYTQNQTIGDKKYASKIIMDELKYLTFDFFNHYGCQRTDCTPAEYYNKEVDRLVIIYRYNLNNWNRKIC
jgi:hypothetical protein